ncbi:MAG: histidine phosphatase family protein [Gammaproteobacteria bacterium]
MSGSITLMRHGRPVCAQDGWVGAQAFADWIARYDAAEVAPAGVPEGARAAAADAVHVVCSELPRALTSVAALGRVPSLCDARFGEAALPWAPWRGLRLPVAAWAGVARLLWLAGWSGQVESRRAARLRAAWCARRLAELAADGPVLLVGHGIMNRMIAAELCAGGWESCGRAGARYRSGYWSAQRFAPGSERPL